MKKVSDDFQLEGQMSIFDLPFMQAPVSEELPGLKEITELIGKKYSLYFAYRDRTKTKYAEFDCYEAKYMGGSITLDEGHYATRDERDGKRFIGVDAMYKTSGMSRPCDTLEEIEKAVKTSKECIAKWKDEEQRKPVCKHSKHECNKEALWEVADSLDDTTCPHTCCRECSVKCCGARCNGSSEPVEQCTDNAPQEEKVVCPDGKWDKKCATCKHWHFNKYADCSCEHTDCGAPEYKHYEPSIQPLPIQDCGRPCKVGYCSRLCFEKRGSVWDYDKGCWMRDEDGNIIVRAHKECDYQTYKWHEFETDGKLNFPPEGKNGAWTVYEVLRYYKKHDEQHVERIRYRDKTFIGLEKNPYPMDDNVILKWREVQEEERTWKG